MKRLGIFVFYDRDGIVDKYVEYLLESLQGHITELVIVCNGIITEMGREKLSAFTDKICIRENKGFDVMAYKMALIEYVGWEEVLTYDEVILLNDTFYGPFYPWKEVFDKMTQSTADFWGLTRQLETSDYFTYGTTIQPAYIQSYFYCFRKSMLSSLVFQKYWNEIDATNWIFSDVVNRHEKQFTKKMEEAGFVWDTYIKAEEFEYDNPNYNINQYYYIAYELIKRHRYPIVKRKNFILRHTSEGFGSRGDDISKAFTYIQNKTDYDTDMIWDNLLRLYPMGDIKKALGLNYVLSDTLLEKNQNKEYKAAIIACITNEQQYQETKEYIKTLETVLPIFTIQMERCGDFKLHEIFLKKVVEIEKDYDYICFIHNLNEEIEKDAPMQGYSLLCDAWENMVKSEGYIRNILQLFETNPRLGFITIPKSIYGTLFGELGNSWAGHFQQVKEILRRMNVTAPLSEQADCLCAQHTFWVRTKSLKPYYDKVQDIIEQGYSSDSFARCYPVLVQQAGYYSATVQNCQQASASYTNMEAVLTQILQRSKQKYSFCTYDDYLDGEAILYCKKYSRIQIYGAGENGYRAACLLKQHGILVDGFIVSDGQPKPAEKFGYSLQYLSELPYGDSKLGIIVAVANATFRAQIEVGLNEKGYKDIYIL